MKLLAQGSKADKEMQVQFLRGHVILPVWTTRYCVWMKVVDGSCVAVHRPDHTGALSGEGGATRKD